VVSKNAITMTKEQHTAFREELRRLIESGEILRYSREQLYKQVTENYGVASSRRIVDTGIAEIYKSIDIDEIDVTKKRLYVLFETLFRDTTNLLENAKDDYEKRKAIELTLTLVEKFTDFLEAFGLKERIATTINIGLEKQLVIIKEAEKVVDAIPIEEKIDGAT